MRINQNAACARNSLCHFIHNVFFRFRFFNLSQEMQGGSGLGPRILDGGWSNLLTQANLSVARIQWIHAQDCAPDCAFNVDVLKT